MTSLSEKNSTHSHYVTTLLSLREALDKAIASAPEMLLEEESQEKRQKKIVYIKDQDASSQAISCPVNKYAHITAIHAEVGELLGELMTTFTWSSLARVIGGSKQWNYKPPTAGGIRFTYIDHAEKWLEQGFSARGITNPKKLTIILSILKPFAYRK